MGRRSSLSSAMIVSNSLSPSRPFAATIPSSAKCARSALITWVCCRSRRSRARCCISRPCCSADFARTNRIFGQRIASHIASASATSFYYPPILSVIADIPALTLSVKLQHSEHLLVRLRRALNQNNSIYVLDDGARAVSAAGGFRVPLALVILVLDSFRVAGDFLLLGGRPRRSERLGMGREGFRKHTVDFIGPAAVVLDNFVGDLRHGRPFEFAGDQILSHLKIRGDGLAIARRYNATISPAASRRSSNSSPQQKNHPEKQTPQGAFTTDAT